MKLKSPRKFRLNINENLGKAFMIFLLPLLFVFSQDGNVRGIEIFTPEIEHLAYERVSKLPMFLVVTADKHYYLNNKEVPLPDLEKLLIAKIEESEYRYLRLVLRLDNSLNVQDLVDLISIGRINNIEMVIAPASINNHN